MKFTAAFTAAAVFLASTVEGQYARVFNNCTFTAYVQSVPYDGSASGPLTALAANNGIYIESYRASGSTIKMGRTSALSAPLFFGYSETANPNLQYYNLNNQYGNPFSTFRVTQVASRAGCPGSNCAPNNSSCYGNNNQMMVRACGRPTNVTTTLCAVS